MIETPDLILRKAVFSDWESIYRNIWRHEESARYMVWSVTKSEEDAKARMERTIRFEAEHEHKWTVIEKKSGEAIGWAGLELIEDGLCEETGVALGPAFTGRGYGRQILEALCIYAKETLGAERFMASCREQNLPSLKLQRSMGFEYLRSEEKTDPRNGEKYTLICNIKQL